jgi:ribosomal protein L13E
VAKDRNQRGWAAFGFIVNERREAGMSAGFEQLMKMMRDERRRRSEEVTDKSQSYRLDDRGALVIEPTERCPAHPLERV